jgi:hypothetical protein
VDALYTGAVWSRTAKLGSSRYRSGCLNQVPVAKCTVLILMSVAANVLLYAMLGSTAWSVNCFVARTNEVE